MCKNHSSRRDFIRMTLGGSAALAGKFMLPWPALAQDTIARGTAKSVVLLWLQGAPSQLDTFDPKPGTKTGGEFGVVETAQKGVFITEHFKQLAKRMDKVSLIRTVHSKDPNHDTAQYLLHTGYAKSDTVEHPHIGSVLTSELGVEADGLPGCISIGGFPGAGAGYLPPDRTPFLINEINKPLDDIVLPPGITKRRVQDREKLLKFQHKRFGKKRKEPQVEHLSKSYDQALELMKSENIKAFDIREESDKTKKRYGNTDFGRATLMARRLVESGVRFVEVKLDGWDTHNDNFNRTKGLINTLDPAYAALLDDLSDRKLMDDTLVICMGEFGRTPNINRANGRDHWSRNWSVALSGGGINGGRVVGRTDALGMDVKERPVSVQDLYATFYHCLGVDTKKEYRSQLGRPIKILEDGKAVRELL